MANQPLVNNAKQALNEMKLEIASEFLAICSAFQYSEQRVL